MITPIYWCGSKKRQIKQLIKHIPENYDTYYELFAGSAILFFYLEPKKAVVSDINDDLINFYQELQKHPTRLLQEVLKKNTSKESYLKIRQEFNSRTQTKFERSVLFFYLIMSCFNGLWNVNKDGNFMTAFGRSNINFKIKPFKEAAKYISNNKIDFCCQNFTYFLDKIKEGDFVYLDPPYIENETSGYVSYNKKTFLLEEHYKLLNFCKILNKRKVKFMLSNSYSEKNLEMYKDFKIDVFDVTRSILLVKKKKRKEILVYN